MSRGLGDVYKRQLTTYGTALRDLETLRSVKWSRVVCDEAQAIKNSGTRQSQAVRAIPERIRLALTGTPFDDAEMEAFLEPWRPQRGRVPTLVALGGLHRPRHGAKMSPRTHLPARVTWP